MLDSQKFKESDIAKTSPGVINKKLMQIYHMNHAQIMGTKVMTVTTQTATTRQVMNGMTIGELGAKKNVGAAVRKSNDVSNDNDL